MEPDVKANFEPREEERVLGLDLLRAIAVTWVVVAHGDRIIRPAFQNFPNLWILDAVDLFFVLSGFLIGRIILRDIVDRDHANPFRALRYFWMRRWLRTLPAYYVTLTACWLLSHFYPNLSPGFDWRYLIFLQNMWSRHPWFMANAWSLAIEEVFYLLFPLATVLLLYFFTARRRAYFVATSLFIVGTIIGRYGLASLLEGTKLAGNMDDYCRKLTPARLDAIAYGTLGAALFVCWPTYWKRAAIPAALLGIALFCAWNLQRPGYHAGWVTGVMVTPVCTLLFLPLFTNLRNAANWISEPIRHISKYSYSVYLVHYPLVLLPIVHIVKPQGQRDVLLSYIAYFVVVMLGSYLLYRIAERPGLEWRKSVSARWRERGD